MTSHGTIDLVQDITTDCSVVASLCAGTAREQRGQSKVVVLPMIRHSFDEDSDLIHHNVSV